MKFESYTITKIDEEAGHIFVTFVFNDDGKKVKVEKRLHYAGQTNYDAFEPKYVDEEYIDKNGKKRIKTVEKEVKVHKARKFLDVTDSTELDRQLKEWASAYLLGLELEKTNKVSASDDVKKLVGVKNTTSL